jgi:hypothetical protein
MVGECRGKCNCDWCKEAYSSLPVVCECGGIVVRLHQKYDYKDQGECLKCGRMYERYKHLDGP